MEPPPQPQAAHQAPPGPGAGGPRRSSRVRNRRTFGADFVEEGDADEDADEDVRPQGGSTRRTRAGSVRCERVITVDVSGLALGLNEIRGHEQRLREAAAVALARGRQPLTESVRRSLHLLHTSTVRVALADVVEDLVPYQNIGTMYGGESRCQYCHAFRWREEASLGKCCNHGKVGRLQRDGTWVGMSPIQCSNRTLVELASGAHRLSGAFHPHSRVCNQLLSFVGRSNRANANRQVVAGVNSFCVQGSLQYFTVGLIHNASPPPPPPDRLPYRMMPRETQFQMYFVEGASPDQEVDLRLSYIARTGQPPAALRGVLLLLQGEMRSHHLYNAFLTAVEVARRDPSMQEMRLQFHRPTGDSRMVDVNGHPVHRGAVNVPTGAPGVVSAVFSQLGPTAQPSDAECDFITFNRAGAVTHLVKFHNALFDSMAYPLIFMTRRTGWHRDMPSADERARVTLREFNRFLLFVRDEDPVRSDVEQLDYITKLGPLWQQYLCELYIRWEVSLLTYLRANVTDRLRAARLGSLQANPNARAADMGVPVRLPARFQYSRAHREQCLNEGYAYMARFGNASYLITLTANPNWPEVVDALRRGESALDRPEVVVRVFLIKARMLLKMVRSGYFGTCLATYRVIEFQLRGLPHMHLLVWLAADDRPRQAEDGRPGAVQRVPPRLGGRFRA